MFENEVQELKKLIDSHNNIVFFGGAGVSTESNIPDFRSSDGLFNQKLNRKNEVQELKKLIDSHNNIVFFGGAGVSTESNIPDFRSSDGLFNQKLNRIFSPEEVVSYSFFVRYPEYFYEFYKDKLIYQDAEPNNAHKALAYLEEIGKLKYFYEFYKDKLIYQDAEPNNAHKALAYLEEIGKLKAVITQNIDGLHQKAGSKNVFELHGSVQRNYCTKCHKFFDLDDMLALDGTIPKCDVCGATVKPDVVLYEEALDENTIDGAIKAIKNADLLIIGGTSLVVYPAASFIDYYRGKDLVLINKSSTSMDGKATLKINAPTVKPDVVLYEEALDENTIDGAIKAIKNADLLIIGGTSLVVYPAASFINYYRGKDLVLINKSSTSMDGKATLKINAPIGKILYDAVLADK